MLTGFFYSCFGHLCYLHVIMTTSVHSENMIINQILRLAHPNFLTKFLVVIARSSNDEAIYHYTGGLLHFARNDTPQRVIARSSNDEAIYRYTGGLLHFVRNDTPQRVIARSSNDEAIYRYTEGLLHFVRNDTTQRVIARNEMTKQSTTIQRGCFTSFAMTPLNGSLREMK